MVSSVSVTSSRVLVTGGAGFIGSHLVRELVARGAGKVIVVDSLRYGNRANLGALGGRVEIVQHTLGLDPPDQLARALEGVNAVFHLAAEKHNQSKDDPPRVYRSNIEGTHALCELSYRAGVQKIVFSSSLYAYGRTQGERFVETELPRPRTVYGVTKLAGEHVVAQLAERAGKSHVILRYLFVYGPRQFAGMGYKSVILKNFERILRGEPPTVYGDGLQSLDYVYVDDVVDATIRAMELDLSGETINIGSGVATSVDRLVDRMVAVSQTDLSKLYEAPDWTAGTSRVGDPSKAERLLGWRATTTLDEGLQRTHAWMRAEANPGAT